MYLKALSNRLTRLMVVLALPLERQEEEDELTMHHAWPRVHAKRAEPGAFLCVAAS
jgi:hypothetical protein